MKHLADGLNFKWSWVSRCTNFINREIERDRKENVVVLRIARNKLKLAVEI